MMFKDNKSYSSDFFSDRIRMIFGSGKFRKINYEALPENKSDSVTVKVNFQKEPQNLIKTGLHYNSDTGIALKLGFSVFGYTNPFSETSADIAIDRKSTRLNSSHVAISYAVFCLKKKKHKQHIHQTTMKIEQ